MADARRMGKMELFAHFADKFDMKRTAVRDLFDELNRLSEKELKRSGEFVLPGMCKLVVQKRKAREGRDARVVGVALRGEGGRVIPLLFREPFEAFRDRSLLSVVDLVAAHLVRLRRDLRGVVGRREDRGER